MKKTNHTKRFYLALPLIAATAFAAAPAQADVTLYGLMDVFTGVQHQYTARSIDRVNTGVVNGGGMSTSYWGLKGKEDLGNGLNVNFKIEQFLRLDTGSSGRFNGDLAFARNAYLGLGGSFGEVRLGRQTTALFVSTVAFNPFGDSYTFSPIVMQTYMMGSTSIAGDSGWSNAISYNSPDMSGFSASAMYSMDETANTTKDKGAISFNYKANGLAATTTYQRVYQTGSEYQDAAVLGVSYDFNVVKLFGQYEWVKNSFRDQNGDDFTTQSGQVGVSVPAGPGKVLASYVYSTTNYRQSNVSNDRRNLVGLGYDYDMSKRTDLYGAVYAHNENHSYGTDYTYGIGIRHRF